MNQVAKSEELLSILQEHHAIHQRGGLTEAQVAEILVISPRTVNAHLRSIYSKLNITSRHALTLFALEEHLI